MSRLSVASWCRRAVAFLSVSGRCTATRMPCRFTRCVDTWSRAVLKSCRSVLLIVADCLVPLADCRPAPPGAWLGSGQPGRWQVITLQLHCLFDCPDESVYLIYGLVLAGSMMNCF